MVTPLRSLGFSQSRQRSARGTLRIAETFVSRQGEGKLTGTESFFIRTSGCNLRCWFCDTPYASWDPQGGLMEIGELVAAAVASGTGHVVLTGGEPMLPRAVTELCRRLRQSDLHVTIETAGTVQRDLRCDLMSISPKFRSSGPDADQHPSWAHRHEQRRKSFDTIAALIERAESYQLKFVVDSENDFDELVETVSGVETVRGVGAGPADVWVMPQGSSMAALDAARAWLEPWCHQQGYQYCDRMQIRWYGNRRGT